MRVKYPRTFHLPWSRSYTHDDKVLKHVQHFEGKEVVVTEKMDGENTTMYRDYLHARSIDSKDHPSRHWIKMFHSMLGVSIPEGWRLCGENMFAQHSIHYQDLPSYFLLFSVWNEQNMCLAWDETAAWAKRHMIETVPVLYRGIWNEEAIKSCYTRQSLYGGEQEGFVVRLADTFHYDDFMHSAAKFVRKNHVQTNEHWMNRPVVPNILKK
ncbi:RNA ligase family protein [Aneurinibacillus aneurinilyticus]|uniref:RNA ligase family protein n=1 Tax=Aneurinibacillus aneurinilyticus TaxID=1391 RepID=A0A848D5P6_ANEAE|nr:RNA ligase family protein [Aneurinibacillus aneurinilyticus]NMF01527.1 RNA ligase family protein [Aneurinibacillus aneurinilyticus]